MTNPEPVEADGAPRPLPRILIVDDHEIGRKSLARLLSALGYDITAVKDGASALEAMGGEEAFDFVLTDVRLPDLDGREVVEVARRLDPAPRIGLITGWDVEQDESDRLGIEWVFLKPLDVMAIVKELQTAPPGR